MRGKRSQSDFLGIALIAMILVLILLFFISSRLNRRQETFYSYTSSMLAQNMLDVLMLTKTDKNIVVEDAIKACYNPGRIYFCRSDDGTVPDCCSYAEATINNALEATLGAWEKRYRLTIKRGEDIRTLTNDPGCDDHAPKEQPGIYPIADSSLELIVVRLDICK